MFGLRRWYIIICKKQYTEIVIKFIEEWCVNNKMKLTTSDQFQTLKLNNINIKNEGKYICRGFSSDTDKLFYFSFGKNKVNFEKNHSC